MKPDQKTSDLSTEEKRALLAKLLKKKAQQTKSQHPLSYNQQPMWFLQQLAPDSPAFHISFAARIYSTVDVPALKWALQTLLERHSVLRTTFVMQSGELRQEIQGYQELSFEEIDASTWDELKLHTQVVKAHERSFDLEKGPMLRASLFRQSAENYVLLITIHHLASDGWSLWLLLDELRTLYAAKSQGKSASLAPVEMQYIDYARWQAEMLTSQEGERLQAYWEKQLAGELPVINLPTSQTRLSAQGFNGDSLFFTLDESLTRRLKTLSSTEGATLYMTLLAVFYVLLYRYSGQDDIYVGAPTFGRNRPGFAGIVGCLMNPVILRAALSGELSFVTLLGQVRQTLLEALDHQDYPLHLVAERLWPHRSADHPTAYQAEFMLQKPQRFGELRTSLDPKAAKPRIDFGGLDIEYFDLPQQDGQVDLTLEMIETDSALFGQLKYNTGLFDRSTAERMLGHYKTLIEGILADPNQLISTLPLITEVEQQQLLVEWNRSQHPDSAPSAVDAACIHHLFEAQVKRTPDSLALISGSEQLTYEELNTRANQLAHFLQRIGVGPEVCVGLFVERSAEMMIGILAVLKAGGAYVPLDPAYPRERLEYMIQDTQTPVILTQTSVGMNLPEYQGTKLYLDTDWEPITQESIENPVSNVAANNMAYIIYTSGSTGHPKGVMIEHRSLVNYIEAASDEFGVHPSDRVLQFASINFDASAEEIYPCLTRGATLVLRTSDMIASTATFLEKCREWQITILDLPTAYWHELTISIAQEGLRVPENLRLVIIGGDKAMPEHIRTWQRCVGKQVRLLNTYGPTEGTIVATMYDLSESRETTMPVETLIGRPVRNVEAYILDKHLQPVPIGVSGELHLGGAGLARGYLNAPEFTNQKFIPSPFSDDPQARLYKTGDLVRYVQDGNIEFLGRVDHQVKIRGFRIELGEIEGALATHPALRETLVLAREDEMGRKSLVAYFTLNPEAEVSVSELRQFLKQNLPDYMIPASFVSLDHFPMTPNGKLDRKALPAPDLTRPELGSDFMAPRTSVEETLTNIWSELLKVEKIGIHDNFFELGGDSILSIQIIAKANQAGVRLTPIQIFQHQTIAELASVAGSAKTIQAEQGTVTGPVKFAPYQKWFFEQNLTDPHHWNMALLLESKEPLDPALIQQAIRQLILHHDALRLRFVRQIDSTWQQTNADPTQAGAIPFHQIDLTDIPASQQAGMLENAFVALQASLNLEKGPLLRMALVRTSANQPERLLLVTHHMVIDGISLRILMEDFNSIYQQLRENQQPTLPSKTTSYQQWTNSLHQYAQSEAAREELDYWLDQYKKPAPRLPVDDPTGINIEGSTQGVTVSLTVEETQALLKDVPTAYNTQINDILLTALAQTLAQWTDARTVLLDLEGHGRESIIEDVDLSRTVGCFTSCFPVLLDLQEADNPGDAIKAIKEQLYAIPNRGIGYGILYYLNRDPKVTSKLRSFPTAEINFNYLGQFDQVLPPSSLFNLGQGPLGPVRSPQGMRLYLIEILGAMGHGQLFLNWTFSGNVYQRATIESLAQHYIDTLRALIQHCTSGESGGFTPSDFPEAQLSQQDLDKFLSKIG